MSEFQIIDPAFARFLIPICRLERLYTGTRWAEGPVYFADGRFLVWSDIPNDRMLRWEEDSGAVSLFRHPAGFSNGNTRDRQGRLVTAEHGARRVTRTEPDGRITVLADRFEGKRLNSPNDVVVKSDGTIWFTDPPYGIMTDYEGFKAESEIGRNNVYRLDPADGSLRIVVDDMDKPNGLAFSPDETILYVADSARSHGEDKPHHIRAYPLADGRVAEGRVLAVIEPGLPDGFRVDAEGNLWTSAGDGVQCIDPGGRLLGKILVPELVSNLTFGGARRNRLFITATTSLYAVFLNVMGAQRP